MGSSYARSLLAVSFATKAGEYGQYDCDHPINFARGSVLRRAFSSGPYSAVSALGPAVGEPKLSLMVLSFSTAGRIVAEPA